MSRQRTNERARMLASAGYWAAPLLLAACDGSGDEVAGAIQPGSSSVGALSGTGDATDQAGGAHAGSSETGSAGSARAAGTSSGAGASSAGGAGEAGAGGASSLSPRLARYHRGTESERALHFELDAVDGLLPYTSSLEYLTTLLGRVLDKPDGTVFDEDETLQPFGQDHVWTFTELDDFARLHAADDASGPVSIHVLFVDGRYDPGNDSGTVLGLAWGERYIALFQDAIRSGCSGVFGPLQTETCELAERSVWAHEIGHVIGLVDNGLAQQIPHRDADRGRHDTSDGCLMYWAHESPAVFDVLLSRLETGQTPDIDFCENCWADLRTAQTIVLSGR